MPALFANAANQPVAYTWLDGSDFSPEGAAWEADGMPIRVASWLEQDDGGWAVSDGVGRSWSPWGFTGRQDSCR